MSLEVVSFEFFHGGKPHYIWKCSCGNSTKPIAYGEVVRGKSKSCGCYRNYLNVSKGSAFQEIKNNGELPYYIDKNGCHICSIGYSTHFGGKTIQFNGEQYLVHRLQYELKNGPIPEGLVVRHKCDVPSCINPDHLELGTQVDNIYDMVSRGRNSRGVDHRSAKLTEDDVRAIRSSDKSYLELAKMYSVEVSTIKKVLRRITWKHVS